MLEVQHGITFGGVEVVVGRGIDKAVAHGLVELRPVVDFPHLALRNVLQGIEILVCGRDVDSAAPAACPIIIQAGGIRNVGPVDIQLIVVEALVLGSGFAHPESFCVFGELIFDAADIQLHALGLRSVHPHADATLGIDHGVLFSGLVVGRRYKVFLHLGCRRKGRENGRGRENKTIDCHIEKV